MSTVHLEHNFLGGNDGRCITHTHTSSHTHTHPHTYTSSHTHTSSHITSSHTHPHAPTHPHAHILTHILTHTSSHTHTTTHTATYTLTHTARTMKEGRLASKSTDWILRSTLPRQRPRPTLKYARCVLPSLCSRDSYKFHLLSAGASRGLHSTEPLPPAHH